MNDKTLTDEQVNSIIWPECQWPDTCTLYKAERASCIFCNGGPFDINTPTVGAVQGKDDAQPSDMDHGNNMSIEASTPAANVRELTDDEIDRVLARTLDAIAKAHTRDPDAPMHWNDVNTDIAAHSALRRAFARAIERELSPSTPAAGAGVADSDSDHLAAPGSSRALRAASEDAARPVVTLDRAVAQRAAQALAAYLAAMRADSGHKDIVMSRIRAADKLAHRAYGELYAALSCPSSTPQAASPTENLRLVGASGPLGDLDVLAASPTVEKQS